MLERKSFLKKYGIKEKDFRKTRLKWLLLESIHDHYKKLRSTLEPHATLISKLLQRVDAVHSIKFRLKDPEHLVEKIIRRKIESPKLKIELASYQDTITDLIGIRALHLFKEDWISIHDFITKTWKLKQKPVANIREGDSPEIIRIFKEKGCQIKKHPFGYRSIHYIIVFSPSRERFSAEIQVRTIFEEGWSEIDHRVRYPYKRYDPILAQFVVIFNRLAGSADEMGSFLRFLKTQLSTKDQQFEKALGQDSKIIRDLKNKLDRLNIEKSERSAIKSGLDTLQKIAAESKPGQLVVEPRRNFIFQPTNSDIWLDLYKNIYEARTPSGVLPETKHQRLTSKPEKEPKRKRKQ